MSRYVDYAPTAPVGRCVILPGGRYTPDGPLLFFAAQAALMRGWEVRQVWWDPPEHEDDAAEVAWVCGQLAAAVDDYPGRVVVVAKSLGTLAAPLAESAASRRRGSHRSSRSRTRPRCCGPIRSTSSW